MSSFFDNFDYLNFIFMALPSIAVLNFFQKKLFAHIKAASKSKIILVTLVYITLFIAYGFSNKYVKNILSPLFLPGCIYTLALTLLCASIYSLVSRYLEDKSFIFELSKNNPRFYNIFCFINKYMSVFIFVFSILMVRLANNITPIDTYALCWYEMDYSLGICSRMLIGTVIKLICPGQLTQTVLNVFLFCVGSIICIFVSILFDIIVKNCGSKVRTIIIYLITVYICSPFCFVYLFHERCSGRPELYALLICLICFFVTKIKNNYIFALLFSVLSVIFIAFSQGNLFIYYQIIFMLMIYRAFDDKKGFKLNNLCCVIFVLLVTASVFIYFQFFGKPDYSYQELVEFISSRTALDYDAKAIKGEYYMSLGEMYSIISHPNISMKNCMALVLYPLKLFPAVMPYLYIIINALNKVKEEKICLFKTKLFYILLANIMYIPQFLINCDWGRWVAAFLTVQYAYIFYLVYKRDKYIIYGAEKINALIEKHYYLAVPAIVYIAKQPLVNTIYL